MKKPVVIAVDGTAASGKGTLAKKLARHFNFPHLDSGALYRLTALAVLEKNGDPKNEADAVKGARAIDLSRAGDPAIRSDVVGKLFVDAAPATRAHRRCKELQGLGINRAEAEVLAEINARDAADRSRPISPLKQADDAFLLDTTDLDIDAAFAAALSLVEAKVRSALKR